MTDAPHTDSTDADPGNGDADAPVDSTLGGYMKHHQRPPAFEGPDGYPYTVSMEVEKTPSLQAPYSGYLVFPRWADTGVGIVGHVETPVLLSGSSREEVMADLGTLSLMEVSNLLGDAIRRRQNETE